MLTGKDIYSSLRNAIILLIPTLTFVEFSLIGRLFLSEIILLGVLPILLVSKSWMLWKPLPKKLITLGLLWLFAQIITDLIRATPFQDYARGWAKITFLLINFAVLYMLLYGSKRRLVLFALGLVFSGFFAYKFNIDIPFSYARDYPWKFGVGTPITLLLVLFSTTTFVSRVRLLPSLILLCLALLNLYMGFRSMAGVCFLVGVYTFTQRRSVAKVYVGVKPSLKKISFITVLVIAAAISFIKSYEYAAEHYWLGKRAKDIVQIQSGSFGLLFGGRVGVYSAVQAIIDSPLIGHGSWAKDPYYIDVLRDLEKFGYTIRGLKKLYRRGIIPSHSSWAISMLGKQFHDDSFTFLRSIWIEAGLNAGSFLINWSIILQKSRGKSGLKVDNG